MTFRYTDKALGILDLLKKFSLNLNLVSLVLLEKYLMFLGLA
jgi:hypothetical protein